MSLHNDSKNNYFLNQAYLMKYKWKYMYSAFKDISNDNE
jgi:hypothetical protein